MRSATNLNKTNKPGWIPINYLTGQNTNVSWELGVMSIALILIVIIMICIWYSYRLANKNTYNQQHNKESFKTYGELVDELNDNRTALLNIKQLQDQKLININPNVDKYISANNIFPDELKDRLSADFDIRFSQELQDTDIKDLQGQLDALKKKMSNLPAMPTKYMLKSLGGSAFDMLGNPNEFSLKINPNEAQCLSFSLLGYNNPVSTNTTLRGVETIYQSANNVQCDISGADKQQRFKTTQINNNQEFNKLVGDLYSVPDYYSLNNYPFLVAQPLDGQLRADGMLSECITFDNSGLSVEPCTGKESQRWHTYTVSD